MSVIFATLQFELFSDVAELICLSNVLLSFLLEVVLLPPDNLDRVFELIQIFVQILDHLLIRLLDLIDLIGLIFPLTVQFGLILILQSVTFRLAILITLLHGLQITFEILQQNVDRLIMLLVQSFNLVLIHALHGQLLLLQFPELLLIVDELLLVKFLQFLLALRMLIFHLMDRLLVGIFLLCLLHLQLLVSFVQFVESLGHFIFEHVASLHVRNFLLSERSFNLS